MKRNDIIHQQPSYRLPTSEKSYVHEWNIPQHSQPWAFKFYISPRGELHAQKMQTVHQSARVVFRAKQANKSVEQMSWSAVECELLRRGDRMEKRRGE